MPRRSLLLLACLLPGCDTGLVTEDGAFLVDLGLQMETARESSPLAVARGSVVCPEVVAQAKDGEFSSTGEECFAVGQGCEALERPGFVDYEVEREGGCASVTGRDGFTLEVVPWGALEVHLESAYDHAFVTVLTDAEGGPLTVPPLHEDGVVTVVEGGMVSARGVPRRGEDFVAYDGATTRVDRGVQADDGSAVLTAADAGPIGVVTPDGPRVLGTLSAARLDAVASLELIAGWTEEPHLGPYVYALRVVARDASGTVLHGAPVQWSVAEGDDVAIAAVDGASDYVQLEGNCEAYRDSPGLRNSRVRASLGALEVELPVVWKDAGFLGSPAQWSRSVACVASEHPPRAAEGCGCTVAGSGGLGWALLGALLAVLRRRRGG